MKGLGFNGGNLYAGELTFGNSTPRLFQLNPLTGATLGTVTVTLSGFTVKDTLSLSTDPDTGILYALLNLGAGSGSSVTNRRLVTLNPLTGVATDIGQLPQGFANIEFGASMSNTDPNPVPEPSTMILLGTGLRALSPGGESNRHKRQLL